MKKKYVIVVDLFQAHARSGGYRRFAVLLLRALNRLAAEANLPIESVVALIRPDWTQAPEAVSLWRTVERREVYDTRGWVNILKREMLGRKWGWGNGRVIPIFAGNFATYLATPPKSVVVVHDTKFADLPDMVPLGKRLVRRALVGRSVRKAAKVVAISSYTKSRLTDLYGSCLEAKVTVVPTALDDGLLSVSPEPSVLSSLGLEPRGFYLTVSTAQPHKNVGTLVKAFRELPRETLVVAGEVSTTGAIPRNVKFLGRVPDRVLVALYTFAKGFLFPSLYEGQGLPVIEAGAFGLPVICSNLPALREVTGGLALAYADDPLNPDQWTQLLRSFHVDDARECGRRLRSFVQGHFSMDRMIQGYKNVLEEVIAE